MSARIDYQLSMRIRVQTCYEMYGMRVIEWIDMWTRGTVMNENFNFYRGMKNARTIRK